MSSSATSSEGNFRIALSMDAANYYRKPDSKSAKRINIVLEKSQTSFFGQEVLTDKSKPRRYRYRVGRLSIIFGVDTDERIVKVFAIVPRGKAYHKKN